MPAAGAAAAPPGERADWAQIDDVARQLAGHRLLEIAGDLHVLTATDRAGEAIAVDAAMVRDRVAPLAASADLSRYIL